MLVGIVVMNPLMPDRMNRHSPRHNEPKRTNPREHAETGGESR
jgi:hypothetical protein